MSAPAIITGPFRCRRCEFPITNAALVSGNYIGNESSGFLCPDCVARQTEEIQAFGVELGNIVVDGEYKCARCDKLFEEGFLFKIDGKWAILCSRKAPEQSCGKWYAMHGGIAKGTEAEWILKLR